MLASVRRPGDERLHQLLREQHKSSLTYPDLEVGASLTGELPAGYHHDVHRVVVGSGERDFQRGKVGLQSWQPHRAAGATIVPADAPIQSGVDVVLVLRAAALYVVAACRIVTVVEEPARFGFAYGTLAIHPERGEESFLIEHTASGEVVFRVAAFSRPRDLIARLGAPVSRAIQRRTTSAYLEGLRRFVADGA